MSLPKLSVPKYSIQIPSSKKDITFRPFLVKEEKLLLMAKESNDHKEVIEAMKTIISDCTYDAISRDDVADMSTFDVEYIFLQIRSKSVGGVVEFSLVCDNIREDINKPCKNSIPVQVDIDKINVFFPENHSPKIKITEDIGCVMKYPSLNTLMSIGDDVKDSDMFDVVAGSVEMIWDKDEVFLAKDLQKEEIITFFDSMTTAQFKSFKEFFETMPVLKHTINVKCTKCNKKVERTLQGIQDFFV